METQEAGLKTVNNTYMESHRILRTPSALVRDALLYIQEIGDMVCKEPRQNWRNSLDSYLLILVKEGCGTITVGEETLAMQAGDVAFLDCHYPYSHCCDARDPWHILWVHCNGAAMPHLYDIFRQRNASFEMSGAAEWNEPEMQNLERNAISEEPKKEQKRIAARQYTDSVALIFHPAMPFRPSSLRSPDFRHSVLIPENSHEQKAWSGNHVYRTG